MSKIFDNAFEICTQYENCEECPCFYEMPSYDEDGVEEDYIVECRLTRCSECINHVDILDKYGLKNGWECLKLQNKSIGGV